MLKSVLTVGVWTMASRVLGFIRDMLMADLIGAGPVAERKIESLLGTRVYLELHVIVEPNWRESKSFVEGLDWRNQLERLGVEQGTDAETDEAS